MFGRSSPLFLPIVLLFAALAAYPAPAAEARVADDGPDAFVRMVGMEAIASLTGKQLSDSQREERFRSILNRAFEMKALARFTLGRYWRSATEAQQKEYAGLFEDFIVQAYAARFRDYEGEIFRVGTVRDINDRERLVLSTLALKDGRTIPVHWRVRGNSGYRVVDVIVEGVSMAITHRDEFAAIISQNGGKVEGLLAALRKKTGRQ